MNRRQGTKCLWLALILVLATQPQLLWACAACYGQDSGPMARGMNWGIFTLLGVIGSVLFGIAAFFVHIGIKSAKLNAGVQSQNQTDKIP